MIFNASDIESLNTRNFACPNVSKAIKLLYRLMRYTNENSDGWAYAAPVTKGASKLMQALKDAGVSPYSGDHATITEDQLKQGITAIRRMATTQKKKQAQYGNVFDFDVTAALRN